MKLNFVSSNTSSKQVWVFVNGLLMCEDDYDWDSIEEIPIFRSSANIRHNDFVTVLTIDTLGRFASSSSRKEYRVEDPDYDANVKRAEGSLRFDHGGDVRIVSDGNSDGGYVTIMAGGVGDGYGDICIPAAYGHHGGDVLITAGQAYGIGEPGTVRIFSEKAIYLDAPNVVVGPKEREEEWPMSSISESD